MLLELREDRELALEAARRGRWSWRWLLQSKRQSKHQQDCIDACAREIVYIDSLIAEVEPLRRYAHLPDHEAHQAAQEEEWMLELMWRAENYLLTGGIPADQMSAMRLHPQFEARILPHINAVQVAMQKKLPFHSVKQLRSPDATER